METGPTALAFAEESSSPTAGAFTPNRPASPAAGVEVALVVTDVEASFLQALAAGAVAVALPTRKPWGQTVAYVRDRDGILVELCSEVAGGAVSA